MPVVLRIKGFRFEFYSSDRDEPPHIHVKYARKHAKFWLEPTVMLEWNRRFRPHELTKVEALVVEHREFLLEAWHGLLP